MGTRSFAHVKSKLSVVPECMAITCEFRVGEQCAFVTAGWVSSVPV